MPPAPHAAPDAPRPLPPRAALEAQLAAEWRRLLAVAAVGREDDFFELGGESMAAVELLALLERRHGVALPLAALLPRVSVARLAELLIAGAAAASRSPLVALQPAGEGGRRPPLVCVHPSGGSVLCYLDLARRLGPGQPFYGLEGPDPRGGEEPCERIEDMAAAYLAAVRAAWPAGLPYRLGGYSFGGYVAFEMARQLAAAGEPPPWVALLDTRAPAAVRDRPGEQPEGGLVADLATVLERHDLGDGLPSPADEKRLWDELADLAGRHLGKVYEGSAPELAAPPPGGRPQRPRRASRMGAIQRFFREYRFLPTGEEIGYTDVRRYLRHLRANLRSSRAYAPAPYPGRVLLFQGTERLTAAETPPAVHAAGWAALALGGLEVRPVPGHHLNLLAMPAVAALAEGLGAALAEGS